MRSTDLEEEALCQRLGTEELKRQHGIQVPADNLKSTLFKSSDKQDFDSTHFITTVTLSPRLSKAVSVSNTLFHVQTTYCGQSGTMDGLMGTVNEYLGVRLVKLLPRGYGARLVSVEDCQVFG